MKKRTGMIFLLILVIVLIIILIFIKQKNGREIPTDTYSSNVGSVLNQGGSVLEYDNKAYIIGENIYSLDLEKNDVSALTNPSYGNFYEKMYIQHNNLLFTSNGNFYAYNLNTKSINKISEGKLEYANDAQYLYTIERDEKEYLYFSSYDKNTMAIDNDEMYNLAYGMDIFFMRKQNDLLLFGSKNSNNSNSVFYVDIGNQKCEVIIDNCNFMMSEGLIVCDALKYDDGTLIIAGMLESGAISDYIIRYDLFDFQKDFKIGELRSSNVEKSFASNLSDTYFVKTISDGKTTLLDCSESLMAKDYVADEIYGDVKLSMNIVDNALYFEDKLIGEVADNSIILAAWHVGDNFYVRCSSSSGIKLYYYNNIELNEIK